VIDEYIKQKTVDGKQRFAGEFIKWIRTYNEVFEKNIHIHEKTLSNIERMRLSRKKAVEEHSWSIMGRTGVIAISS